MAKKMTTDDLVHEVYATVFEAGQCLRYWRVFNDPSTPREWEPFIQTYRAFFWTAKSAFLTTAIVDLFKLYDPQRPAVSLDRLCSHVASDHPGDGSISKAKDLLAAARPLWKRVRVLRHKVFAHRDSDGDVDHWFQVASVSPNDLFRLHSLSEETLNVPSYARNRTSYVSSKLDEPSDFHALLRDLASTRRVLPNTALAADAPKDARG